MLTARELKKNARHQKHHLTPSEAIFKKKLETAGIVFKNHPVVGFFIPDFLIPDKVLAIEIDGGYHDHPEQHHYDRRRDRFLEEAGLTILRIRNEEAAAWSLGFLDIFPSKGEAAFRSMLGKANALKGQAILCQRKRS